MVFCYRSPSRPIQVESTKESTGYGNIYTCLEKIRNPPLTHSYTASCCLKSNVLSAGSTRICGLSPYLKAICGLVMVTVASQPGFLGPTWF